MVTFINHVAPLNSMGKTLKRKALQKDVAGSDDPYI